MDNEANNHQPAKKIILVEDDKALAEIYKDRLEALGYSVFPAADGITALYHIMTESPDLVLLDIMIPHISGDEVLRKMRATSWGKTIPVYVISNLNEQDVPENLRGLGIAGYSVKANMQHDDIDKIVSSILHPPIED